MPVFVFYGKEDWMCDKGAKRLSEQQIEHFKLVYISKAGHNMTMDNPKEILLYLMNDFDQIKIE